VPRTLTGKKMELPIRKLLLGADAASVANPEAVPNPQSLGFFVAFAARRAALPQR
jgi:acetoacetyl-CoA synthetase